jgi:hypothetical protein
VEGGIAALPEPLRRPPYPKGRVYLVDQVVRVASRFQDFLIRQLLA